MYSKYLFLLPVLFFFFGLCNAQIPDSVLQDINSLKKYNENLMYAENAGLAYPVIDGIPCLFKDNAILTTHLLTNYKLFKKKIGAAGRNRF